jgi:hypothetical protein
LAFFDRGSYRPRLGDDLGPESLGQSIGREYVYRDAQQLQQFVPYGPNVEQGRFGCWVNQYVQIAALVVTPMENRPENPRILGAVPLHHRSDGSTMRLKDEGGLHQAFAVLKPDFSTPCGALQSTGRLLKKYQAIICQTKIATPPRPHPMLRQASTIAYYTLLEALRNRLMWLLGLVMVIGIGLSGFLGDLAVTEQQETRVALLAAFLRFAAAFLMVIFVVTSLVREANDKGLELVLALPLPRAGYVLGKLAGFALLSVLPALMFGGLLGLLVQTWDAAFWTASLLAELWIVAAFSLLCVMTFQQVMTALSAAMGFYLLARSVTALQQYGQSRYAPDGPSQQVINAVMQGVGYVLPRLDDFTRTDWLVYHSGSWATLGPLAAQTLIYLALLTAAALFDLYRRNL